MALDKEASEAAMRVINNTPNYVHMSSVGSGTVCINWGRPGIGFGGIYISTDAEGKTVLETESMGKEFVKEVLCQLVDEATVVD